MEYTYGKNTYDIRSLSNRMDHRKGIEERINKLGDNIVRKDGGYTVYKPSSNVELSDGCKSCKEGKWWCLFMGNKCNLKCNFCPKPKTTNDMNSWTHPRSIVRYWIDDVKSYIDLLGSKISGVSYSGGEPLLYVDKILEISSHVNESGHDIYQWVYTNGLLLTKDVLKKFSKSGIREVRIDLGAVNFDSSVMAMIPFVRDIVGRVTVEVPSMMNVREKLITEGKLLELEKLGVTQLNLAELVLMQDCNFREYGEGQDLYRYDFPNGDASISPNDSRHFTFDIIEYAIANDVDMIINDCSNDAKHLHHIMRTTNTPIGLA
jgi:Uncharacterized conserved protein related to pyruvate formate-lyase activating enzyme